jgi:predicted nucleic acid-binding protein
MEVVRGFHRIGAVHRADQFVSFLSEVEILSFDMESAILAGRIDAALTNRGRIIGVADVAIAACALQQGYPVCTGNRDHYQYIQDAGFPVVLHNWRVEDT